MSKSIRVKASVGSFGTSAAFVSERFARGIASRALAVVAGFTRPGVGVSATRETLELDPPAKRSPLLVLLRPGEPDDPRAVDGESSVLLVEGHVLAVDLLLAFPDLGDRVDVDLFQTNILRCMNQDDLGLRLLFLGLRLVGRSLGTGERDLLVEDGPPSPRPTSSSRASGR